MPIKINVMFDNFNIQTWFTEKKHTKKKNTKKPPPQKKIFMKVE